MNKIYDKLLLAISVLILAGGVMLYLQKPGADLAKGQPDATPANNPYQPKTVADSEDTDVRWPEPVAQSSGPNWFYDVFTPPKIYIRDGILDADPPIEVIPPPPFGVYLEGIVRKPYRLQLEGYIEEDLSDSSKSLLLLYNEEAQKQVRARPGDEKLDADFKLLSFDIERVRDADNNVEKKASAVILDLRSGEEVTLIHGDRLFDQAVTVVIRSAEDPTFEIVLNEAPAEFEGPTGQYTLEEINLEEFSVTVEKRGNEEIEPESRVLKASAVNTTPKEENPAVEVLNEGSDEIFDSIF